MSLLGRAVVVASVTRGFRLSTPFVSRAVAPLGAPQDRRIAIQIFQGYSTIMSAFVGASRISHTVSRAATAFAMVLLAAGVGLIFAGVQGTLAPVWIANVVLLATSARSQSNDRRAIMLGGLGGIFVANLIFGMPLALSVILAIANVAEVMLACYLIGKYVPQSDRMHSLPSLWRFLFIAGGLTPLVSTAIAIVALWFVDGSHPLTTAWHWLPANALGMIIVGPLLMTIGRTELSMLARPARQIEAFVVVALVGLTTFGVFAQSPYPMLFIIMPALILAAFRLQFAGTAMAVAAVALIASMMTIEGYGPIAHNVAQLDQRILYLQFFLAIAVVATLPVAAIVSSQARLVATLTDSERRFRRLVAAAPIAMFGIDRSGRFTFANAGWMRLIGVEDAALDAVAWRSLTDQRTADRINALQFDPHRRESITLDIELHPQRGDPRWIALSLSPQRDDSEHVAGWIGVAVDIQESHSAAQALSKSEALYRLLAENSNDMIVRIGLDGIRRYISPAVVRMLGFTAGEMIGQTPIAAIHPDDRARVERVCRSLLEGEIDPICTYRQMRKDGDYAWLEATYSLVVDDSGTPLEFVASVRDISKRRDAEQIAAAAAAQLEESNRLLTMAESLASLGHWRLDVPTGALHWSNEVYRIHGRDPHDLPTLSEGVSAYHPDDQAMVTSVVQEALENGTPWSFEARIVRPDGEVRHVASQGQAERAPNDEIVGLFGVFQDVTALVVARNAANAAAASKSAFLATMSHEIRTPMTGVLGMIELLRNDPPAVERQRFLNNLDQSANLLMTVLDDVLDYSKIDSNKLVLEERGFDLGELVRMTINLFHNGASEKGLLITLAAPTDPIWLVGDPTRLQQVLSNLISNGIKFTQEGSVTVHIVAGNGMRRRQIRIEVIDTGIGIPADRLEALFEPFVQADPSTTRKFGGSGLGLAIARRLMHAMGGRLHVHSVFGLGSTFTVEVELPIARTVDIAGPDREGAAAERVLNVLVAEDNQVNQALIAALVGRDGHTVTCVENGALAVAAAARQRFDLILMDMQMPELDGLAATREIRAGGPSHDVPIVALTADASPERRHLYHNAGLTDFMTKPIDSVLLRDRLNGIASGAEYVHEESDAAEILLDHAKLASLADAIGRNGVDRLCNLFVTELRTSPTQISSLANIGDVAGVHLVSHGLRGAASTVGASAIVNVCAEIENAAEIEDIRDLADQLRIKTRRTLVEISSFKKANSG